MKTRKAPVVLKETFDPKQVTEIVTVKKKDKKPNEPILDANGKTKGQLFKEQFGFSKTFKRNMQKAGFDPYSISQRYVYRKERNEKKYLK